MIGYIVSAAAIEDEVYTGRVSGNAMSGLSRLGTMLVAIGPFYVAGDGRFFCFQLLH
jgi:hypothetical protein